MTESHITIVRTADRPELVPVVAHWVWTAFWQRNGYDLEHVLGVVGASLAETGPQQTFVLLVDGTPAGTASLVVHDLEERTDLTPWLAGVFVTPAMRGRGYALHLVAAVEDACRAAAVQTVWLYTTTAERVYLRGGWQTVSTFEHRGKIAALMRRDLVPGA